MREPWWLTWSEVRETARDRTIVLYGRSEDWIPKTLQKLPHRPAYIVDMNPACQGTEYQGLTVRAPDVLCEESKEDTFILITTGQHEGVVRVLTDMGFDAGRGYACCPEYYDLHRLIDIRDHEIDVIVSVSDYLTPTRSRHSRAGGGLYRYRTGSNELDRLVAGQFRQMARVGDLIYVVEFVEGAVFVVDGNFQVVERFPLDRSNYCGIAHDPDRNILILVNSSDDTISLHDERTFRLLERAHYSGEDAAAGRNGHHLNDACMADGNLYVSYFSHPGSWQKGILDGGVSEIRIDSLGAPPLPIVSGLWKPHSPKYIDGALCYLDSMRGLLFTSSTAPAGEFPGFLRGLAFDGRYYLVGQSEDMYMSQALGAKGHIMLNAGFYLYDPVSKASRFCPMLDNMNVHDLIVL